ncbi:putative integral membrane protein [Snodgrassella communis]|uniref:RDD family protein n=1 Tax=Snodgrassella communis TaxID=2946699 RepID=UPI000460DFFA|nr:RDD family protein [Snodgrassella communis]KDN13550.1 putative integral membrane protein [Snodgrassella communis]
MSNTQENFSTNNHQYDHTTDRKVEVELASPWNRISAYIINNLLLTLVAFIGCIPAFIFVKFVLQSESENIIVISLIICISISLLVYAIFQFIQMSKTGQSFGKRLMGIKVIGIDGQNPGFVGTVLLREGVFNIINKIISVIVVFIFVHLFNFPEIAAEFLFTYLLPFICLIMLFRKSTNQRTLQDYLARTIVIKAEK